MDKIKALNTKVMAKDFGRVGLGTLAIVAGAFLWGKFLYGRGVRGFHKAGTAEMETQIQEQGLSRPFAFYFPYAAGRKAC